MFIFNAFLICLLSLRTFAVAGDYKRDLCSSYSCGSISYSQPSTDIHQLHKNQHEQSVNEARRKITGVKDRLEGSYDDLSASYGPVSLSDITSGNTHRFNSHAGSSSFSSNSAYDSSSSLFDRHMSTNLADRDYHLRYEPEDYTVSPLGSSSRHLQSYDKYSLEEKQRSQNLAIPVVHYPSTFQDQYRHQTSGLRTSSYSVPNVQFALSTPASLSDEYLRSREDVRYQSKVAPSAFASTHTPYSPSYSPSYSSSLSSSSSHSNSRQNLDSTSRFSSGLNYGHQSAPFGQSSDISTLEHVPGPTADLKNYISEAERLARLQAQEMTSSGTRTGGSQLPSHLDADHSLNLLSGVKGSGNGNYQSKSWQKASKWSSQSEYDSNGQVKNFNEISTGESEQYDVNGHRTGYKAATSTLNDNGKVSSYSVHT